MHVISRKKLREFWEIDRQAESPLNDWHKKLGKLSPANLAELRQSFPHADLVGKCIVFNIGGNKYRIVTKMYFEQQTVLVRAVMTHDEYSKDRWKADC